MSSLIYICGSVQAFSYSIFYCFKEQNSEGNICKTDKVKDFGKQLKHLITGL